MKESEGLAALPRHGHGGAPEYAIRPAHGRDVDEVLTLWALAYAGAPRAPDDRRLMTELIDDSTGGLLVAELEGRMVGSVIAAWDGWRGNLYRVAVAPDHRRLGIARRLVAAGEAHLRARGARRLSALVARDDPGATALWRACGYGDQGGTHRMVKDL